MTSRKRRRTVALFSRYRADRNAGGIEAVVSELLPRLARALPDVDFYNAYAFPRVSRLSKVPLLCDVLAACSALFAFIRSDVVVVNGAEYAAFAALVPALRHRLVVVWHGTRASEIPFLSEKRGWALQIYKMLETWLQRPALNAKSQVVVAPSVLDEIATAYRRIEGTVIVNGRSPLPKGLDAAPLPGCAARDPDVLDVVWIGTTAYKKGLDIALEACAIAVPARALRLHIVGLEDPPNGLPTYVCWHGIRPRAEVLRLVSNAALFLVTTRYEACSMAVVEAAGLGTPIIGSPAIAWMLVEPNVTVARLDSHDFARALLAFTPREDHASRTANVGLTKRYSFDWEDSSQQYASVIRQALNR